MLLYFDSKSPVEEKKKGKSARIWENGGTDSKSLDFSNPGGATVNGEENDEDLIDTEAVSYSLGFRIYSSGIHTPCPCVFRPSCSNLLN